MTLILHDIFCSLDEGAQTAPGRALLKLGLPPDTPASVCKVSIDARGRGIKFVVSVALDLPPNLAKTIKEKKSGLKITIKASVTEELQSGDENLVHRPVVVGFGPAGMFAALALAKAGMRPIVLDRGGDIESRRQAVERFWSDGVLDGESNVQFGEGGAGAFSDGKLTTRIGDPRCDLVLDTLVRFGAPPDILFKAKPHIGTDMLAGVVKNLREEVIRLGGEVRFNTKMTGLDIVRGRVEAVQTPQERILANAVVLALGHSARDSFELLSQAGVIMSPKPFSVGVRIEHLQSEIDKALYGVHAGHPNLWSGEYQLSHREGDAACYTFCMCPGGQVVAAASAQGQLVTNGMSRYARELPNANSALVVAVDPAGEAGSWRDNVDFQRQLEESAMNFAGGKAPAQSIGLFIEGKAGLLPGRVEPSYPHGVAPCSFDEFFPPAITAMMRRSLPVFGRRLRSFDAPDAILTGVESRTSSPLRIPRGEQLFAKGIDGLYPCGEGAGYAGGIMSAAVDGLRVASAMTARYSAPK